MSAGAAREIGSTAKQVTVHLVEDQLHSDSRQFPVSQQFLESQRLHELFDQAAVIGARIAVAESLTGGLLADAIVSVPGASRVFSGGVVAYDTALKQSLLRVDAALLADRGPVDPGVAMQMAAGVREACAVPIGISAKRSPATIGISTTGVAGPDPDPATGQPVGTVWIGISSKLGERAVQVHASGDRREIRALTVSAALKELAVELRELDPRVAGK